MARPIAYSIAKPLHKSERRSEILSSKVSHGAPLKICGEKIEILQKIRRPSSWHFVNAYGNSVHNQCPHHYGKRTAFRQQRLEKAIYVFVKEDSIRKPLQHLYTGPHEVVRRENEHVYVIHMNGRNVAYRLKPFYPMQKRPELSQEKSIKNTGCGARYTKENMQ